MFLIGFEPTFSKDVHDFSLYYQTEVSDLLVFSIYNYGYFIFLNLHLQVEFV